MLCPVQKIGGVLRENARLNRLVNLCIMKLSTVSPPAPRLSNYTFFLPRELLKHRNLCFRNSSPSPSYTLTRDIVAYICILNCGHDHSLA